MRGGTIMTTRGARAAACVVRVSVYELDADESNEREKVLRFRPPSRAQGWGGGGGQAACVHRGRAGDVEFHHDHRKLTFSI